MKGALSGVRNVEKGFWMRLSSMILLPNVASISFFINSVGPCACIRYWILVLNTHSVLLLLLLLLLRLVVADSSRRSAFYLCFRDLALRSVRDIVIENVPFCHKAIPRVPYKWYIEYYDTYSYGTVSVTIIFHYYFSFLTPTPQEKREELFRKPCEGPR